MFKVAAKGTGHGLLDILLSKDDVSLSCLSQKRERECPVHWRVVLDTHPASVNNGLDAPAQADICLHS